VIVYGIGIGAIRLLEQRHDQRGDDEHDAEQEKAVSAGHRNDWRRTARPIATIASCFA
jgi:hypothetical protein